MPEWKMHNLENDRKVTPWKMIENIGNAHPGKCQKNHTLENDRKSLLENARIENAQPGK